MRSENFLNVVRSDASANPGTSGGPMIDFEGNVGSTNSPIHCKSGGYVDTSFAFPIDDAMEVANPQHGGQPAPWCL